MTHEHPTETAGRDALERMRRTEEWDAYHG